MPRSWILPSLLFATAVGSFVVAQEAAPSGPGQRRIFYVRQTVGDDANDGLSPEEAWRSLSMLEDTLRAGDTAYVGPGLYREKVSVSNGGNAEARITFIADTTGEQTTDPPGVVMITGADPVDGEFFEAHSIPGLFVAPSPALVLGVVEMDGSQYRYAKARNGASPSVRTPPTLGDVARLPSSYFYDRETKEVYVRTSDGKPPASHEIEIIRRDYGIVAYGKPHVSVIGFTFRHMGVAGINFESGSDNGAAVDNTSYGSWQGVRVCGSAGVLIAGNTLFRNDNCGIYFLSAARNGFAVGNVAYENSNGIRWSSASAGGAALQNVVFANRQMGISIENADDIRLGLNVLVDNAISQLRAKESRYTSLGNCFESRGVGQLIAKIDFHEEYETLAEYRRAQGQEPGSREACGPLPVKVDVQRLHAETSAYAERARKLLVGAAP
jgi:parallel beta-helix repeat protein